MTSHASPESEPQARRRARLVTIIVVVLVAAALAAWAVTIAAQTAWRPAAHVAAHSQLPDSTGMGAVKLNVVDLDTMRDFYSGALGLPVLHETETGVELGYDRTLIALDTSADGVASPPPSDAGLYHSAILYPDDGALAGALLGVAESAPMSYQGSADHAVSQAFYFVDPEGNGLELYVDRPSEEWRWVDGEVQMGSAPLDPNAFIAEHLAADDDAVGAAALGHVHLKVGDLAAAEAFYADTLGFAVTARADDAVFYAAGGYHHHVATNTWQSAGAGARSTPAGLGSLSITVDGESALDELEARLESAKTPYERAPGRISVDDPWSNEVLVEIAA